MQGDKRPFILTTLPDLGNEPVILQRGHIFHKPHKKDIFLNEATFNANADSLVDIAPLLDWGDHSVWRFVT